MSLFNYRYFYCQFLIESASTWLKVCSLKNISLLIIWSLKWCAWCIMFCWGEMSCHSCVSRGLMNSSAYLTNPQTLNWAAKKSTFCRLGKVQKNILTIFIMTVSTKKSDASWTSSLSQDNAASFRWRTKKYVHLVQIQDCNFDAFYIHKECTDRQFTFDLHQNKH